MTSAITIEAKIERKIQEKTAGVNRKDVNNQLQTLEPKSSSQTLSANYQIISLVRFDMRYI